MEILEYHHLDALKPRLQEKQFYAGEDMRDTRQFAGLMRAAGPCAAFLHDGAVVACAGMVDYPGTDRCVLWVLFARDIRDIFAALVQKMRRLLLFYPRRRYEAHIDPTWLPARKLVKLAGFKREGLMEQFEADGSDRELWALVRGGGHA